ncbi:antibiotic biosynthesis monooxygenase family protein [Larkinella rosea]|uniref:ABM domain-containing protein n=1 Tax=Larkinella rosea TaxID=2025312 RepID=A0A3P1BAJ2_9BACT|nr:hypothetical protein [Larkinella rosea]RRA98127.1 hypothetical protein EHT25_31155 [Larkinella rosea]
MFARTLEGGLRAEALSDATTYFRLSIGPALRQQPGFLHGQLLANSATNQCMLLMIWETQADRQAADANRLLQTLLGHLQHYCIQPLVPADYELNAQVS